jgi:serine protease
MKATSAMTTPFRYALLIVAVLTTGASANAQVVAQASREYHGEVARSARAKTTGRIIVRWREQTKGLSAAVQARKASNVVGLELQASATTGDQQALTVVGNASARDIESAALQLAADPDVVFAVPEYRRKPHAFSNDVLLSQQWYLLGNEPAATRTDSAWEVTQGTPAIVVAVLDTGVRFEHPDLLQKVTNGYDFVSDPLVANDSTGRDSDAADPGDWVTPTDVQQHGSVFDEDCLSESGDQVNSSWHGTRVSGLIGARTNNTIGIAGNAWNTQVLAVRVLGKCGGLDFDIIDAMRWAAGIPVAGVPNNPTPAHVINLSLGGEGVCTTAYQTVINEVIARGVLVVASAGNEGTGVSAPANCNGVLGVAGLRHAGSKVGFSNLGPKVGIAAPGGNCGVTTDGACLYSIVVATNTGATTPSASGYTDQFNFNVGTSFSAPMVASAAALLRAVNGALTPAQTILLLQDTATPFPIDSTIDTCTVPSSTSSPQDGPCNCTTDTCGAGMLNTGAAVSAAQRPLAVLRTSGTLAVGSTLTINGASSFANQGRALVTHQWSVVNVNGTTPTIANADASATTLQTSGTTQFTLRLTVTDDQGAQDTKEIALATPIAAPTPTPTPTPTPIPDPPAAPTPAFSGSGGGGGQLGWELLGLALLACAAVRARSRCSSRCEHCYFGS